MWIYIQTLLIYLFITWAMIMLGKKYIKTNKFGYIVTAIVVYAFIFSFRYGVGADYFSYLEAYDLFAERGQWINDEFEPGFEWLVRILAPFHSSVFFFFVVAFLQLMLYALCFKADKQLFPYLFFVFMFTGIWSIHANAMRQVFAMGLWVLAIKAATDKKILLYYVLIGLAFLFHKSALFLLVFYPIIRVMPKGIKNIPIQLVLFFSAIGVMSLNLTQDFVTALDNIIRLVGYDQMDRRADLIEAEVGLGIGFYLTMLLNFVIICFSNKMKDYFNNTFLNVLYTFYFVGILINYVFINSMMIGRINLYFYSFDFIIISYMLYYSCKVHKNALKILVISLVIASFAALIYRAKTSWNLFVIKGQTEYYYLHKGHDNR